MAPTTRTRTPKVVPVVDPASAPVKAAPKAKAAKASKAAPAAKKSASPTAAKGKAAAVGKATPASKAAPKTAAKGKAPAKAAPKAAKAATKAATTAKSTKAAPKGKVSKKAVVAASADPVVLDHSSYPHIFELIVNSAGHGGLLALRAANKTLRERCDNLLAHHLILAPGLSPPKGAKWAKMAGFLPRGPAKARMKQYRVMPISHDGGRLPGWVCDYNHVTDNREDTCGDDCTALRSRWETAFLHTRVVDIHPWHGSDWRMVRARDTMKNVEVARFYPNGSSKCIVQPRKMVVFTNFGVDFEGRKPSDWDKTTYAETVYLDSQVRHLVVRATYDCSRPTLPVCWVSLPSRTIEWVDTTVLIFAPEPGTTSYSNPIWIEKNDVRANGWLWTVCSHLRVGSTSAHTLVGVSEAPQECFGIMDGIAREPQQLYDLIMDNILQEIRDDLRGELDDDRAAEIRGQVTFMTTDEYRKHVGEEQFAIDTVPTPRHE
ncbi:uncharacterized protein EHS24_001064 [Apiotrichum porosum]|uniref:Uncharacterized protein n=1 Tax=Apiotrichum porosum TaxID=105984 RepID=A0A427YBH7_9TREE|nr:uncharacterized protein EHS24_001064 [Apiotrichum porosum]RSH88519.1 hypothetical protein EHS24_001064 [Apiotrichum porosum]